jgi:hypothetical protein
MLVHERLHLVEPRLLAIRHIEVHWAFLTFLNWKSLAALSPRSLFTARPFIALDARRDDGSRALAGGECAARIDIPAFKP